MKKLTFGLITAGLSISSLWASDHYYKKFSAIDDPVKSLYEDHYIESKRQTEIFQSIVGELKSMRRELSHAHQENQKLQGILRQQNALLTKLVAEMKDLAQQKS